MGPGLEGEADRAVHLVRARRHLAAGGAGPTQLPFLDALWAAPEVTGKLGRVAPALPHDDLLALLAEHGRLG